jgi:hypothetical protein
MLLVFLFLIRYNTYKLFFLTVLLTKQGIPGNGIYMIKNVLTPAYITLLLSSHSVELYIYNVLITIIN